MLLGIGSGVVLLAVVAVRLSTRVGLPSLLLYLAIGRPDRRVGPGDPVRRRRADADARARRPRAHPRRRWALHPVVDRAPRAGPGDRPVHGVRRGQHRHHRLRAALAARAGPARGLPVGRRALVDRRGRGLQRAARTRARRAARRGARAGVRAQRRPRLPGRRAARLPGRPVLDRPAARRLRAGHRRRARRPARPPRRRGPQTGRAAGDRALPPRHARRLRRGLRPGPVAARLGSARLLRRGPGPRQRGPPAPRGHPVVRRGPRLARPDRAVRAPRALRLPGPPARRRHPGC